MANTTVTRRYSYIAIGANLQSNTGAPKQTLVAALQALKPESLSLVDQSQWYHTPAFPAGSGPDFVNAVVKVSSDMSAEQVLSALHRIEAGLGRERGQRWGARVCDLDLLDHEGQVLPNIATWRHWYDLPLAAQQREAPDQLILPHPRLQDRAFVLVPFAEIARDWRHPVLGLSAIEMRDNLPEEEIEQIRADRGG